MRRLPLSIVELGNLRLCVIVGPRHLEDSDDQHAYHANLQHKLTSASSDLIAQSTVSESQKQFSPS